MDLSQAGWGVVFAEDADPAIREALGGLLEHRRGQAGRLREGRYREFGGEEAYRAGETGIQFRARYGVGPEAADPDKVPYYLLLVGSPAAIPFRFQVEMDATYAVGRIHFDTPAEYERYARGVVAAESAPPKSPRDAVLFGVENSSDQVTRQTQRNLMRPLYEELAGASGGWRVRLLGKDKTTKASLRGLLRGAETPDLLFAAGHGLGFPRSYSYPEQRARQGALVCRDWPGPRQWDRAIPPEFYFSADDVPGGANLSGLVAFLIASYSVGTSHHDEFAFRAMHRHFSAAEESFLSQLPQRLLSHPDGGALAVVGQLDRLWGYAGADEKAAPDWQLYSQVLKRLFEGSTLGWAVELFNERTAELASLISAELEGISFGKAPETSTLAGLWMNLSDARNHIVFGDPAVRISAGEGGAR
ncbi:MAG TPA: hypothetical protein VF659_16755 [Pyrinomonadaceae bacterium]